jgi:hypothetical protein
MKTNKLMIFISIVLVLMIVFVYPTPFYYTHIKINDFELPVKINRLTGSSQMLDQSGWSKMEK